MIIPPFPIEKQIKMYDIVEIHASAEIVVMNSVKGEVAFQANVAPLEQIIKLVERGILRKATTAEKEAWFFGYDTYGSGAVNLTELYKHQNSQPS